MTYLQSFRRLGAASLLGCAFIGCKESGGGCGIVAPSRSVTATPATLDLEVGQQAAIGVAFVTSCADDDKTVRVESDNTAIVTVARTANGATATAVGAGTTTLTLTAVGNTKTTVAVTVRISLSAPTLRLRERQTTILRATVATTGALTRRVTFTSSAPAIASVSVIDSVSATITGVAPGGADITVVAVSDPSQRATAKITVDSALVATVAIAGIADADSILLGSTRQLAVTVRDSGGFALVGRPITWASQDSSALPVSTTGEIRALASRSSRLTATVPIGDGTGTRTASVTVKVYGTLVVVVSPRTTSVPEGQTVQLTAVVTGTTGISRVVQWETGNASRATVSATGVVSGLTAGTPVAIRARSIAVPGAVDSTAVTVLTRSVPTAISLTPRNDTLFPLGTRTLTASVLDQRGSVIAGAPVIWRSLTPAVARVSATGIVTADSQGVARILARTPTTIGTDSLSDTTTILIVAPCSLVRPIQFGTTYNGTFDVSSCRNYLGFTGALDQFSVTAAQQTYYSIRLTPSFVGSLVPLNVGAGLYGILPTDTTVQALGVIRPGTFGFMVASTTTAPGTYVVSTTLNPDARLSCVVTDVTRGVDFQTALTPNCQQRDIRILPALDPNGRITVTARSQSFPVRIELRAFSNNAVLGTSTATFTGGTATINYTTTTFRFVYVRVFGPPSANDYITITIDNQ